MSDMLATARAFRLRRRSSQTARLMVGVPDYHDLRRRIGGRFIPTCR